MEKIGTAKIAKVHIFHPNLREFVLTTVILLPGVGYPGSVLGCLTPFPRNPVNPLNPAENSRGLKKRYKTNIKLTFCSEKGPQI